MDPQTLQLFSRQLAHWAEEIVDSGRFPFRRAETSLPLLTDQGELCLPLVLWVNRDSFMAGGLFLFPPPSEAAETRSGIALAGALGVRYFVNWAPQEVVIWEIAGEEARPHRSLALPADERDSPESFHDLLRQVLEELKLLAITGALPPDQLSPWYLANLFRMACAGVIPSLTEALRIARGEDRLQREIRPLPMARQQSVLATLRLLALIMEDRLPPAIPPEGLDRALGFALESLPPYLARVLAPSPWELPLPEEGSIRLHHLFRRLGQLRLTQDRLRVGRALDIFFSHEALHLEGYPPPSHPLPPGALLVHCDRHGLPAGGEIASPALLAFSALRRHLAGEPPVPQAVDVFSWAESALPGTVIGTLPPSAPSSATERRTVTAHLRLSWPNRRFPAPPSTPRWFWEWLHLLGLAGDGAVLDLLTPAQWLTASWADPLFALLRDHFTLLRLERHGEGLRTCLLKQQSEATTMLRGAEGERTLPWERLREGHRSLLPLALDLPQPLFSLLGKGRLQIDAQAPWERYRDGIARFSRSSAGRHIWLVLSGGIPLPVPHDLETLRRLGFPLPEPEVLMHLQQLPADLAPAAVDRELEGWLGTVPAAATPVAEAVGRRRSPRLTDSLVEEVGGQVFSDGLPKFPEHYLYDHYRPQLTEYRFTPPLTAEGEFFDQVTLLDGGGQTLTVEGAETAQALLLAGYTCGSPVALPVDRQLTAGLLARYLADLHRLRQALVREAHRRLPDSRTADQLIDRIWSAHPLPPWPLVAGQKNSSSPRHGV